MGRHVIMAQTYVAILDIPRLDISRVESFPLGDLFAIRRDLACRESGTCACHGLQIIDESLLEVVKVRLQSWLRQALGRDQCRE